MSIFGQWRHGKGGTELRADGAGTNTRHDLCETVDVMFAYAGDGFLPAGFSVDLSGASAVEAKNDLSGRYGRNLRDWFRDHLSVA